MVRDNGEHVDQPLRPLHAVGHELMEKIDSFLAEEPQTPLLRDVQARLRVSMEVVQEALGKYRCVFFFTLSTAEVADAFGHRPEEISISYNGGKDCMLNILSPLLPPKGIG
jgi:FAD synthetase